VAAKVRAKKLRPRKAAPSALYNPLATLGGPALKKAAGQATDVQYGPVLAGLRQQLAQTTTQGTALAQRGGDYYRQVAQEEAAALSRQQALGDMLNRNVADLGAGQQSYMAGLQGQEAQREAQDASVRGGGLGGGSNVQGELGTLAASMAQQRQAQAAGAAEQGANWTGLLGASAAAASARGGEVQGQLLNRLAGQQQTIRGQISTQKQGRAAALAENVLKLRQQGFENYATGQTLGLKQAGLVEQTAKDRAASDLARARLKQSASDNAAGRAVTIRGQNLSHLDRQATVEVQRERIAAAKKGGVAKPLTGPQLGKVYSQIDRAGQLLKTLPAGAAQQIINQGYYTQTYTNAAGNQAQRRVPLPKLDPLAWQAAQDLQGNGRLQPDTVRALHAQGVVIGSRYPTASGRSAQRLRRRPH
jgi:hypothetical protein